MYTRTLSYFVLLIAISTATPVCAQHEWIAPEGKIINYRTLLWSDFLGRPDKDEDPNTGAAVRPAIYATSDSAEEQPGGRLTFKFHVKCAFQSAAWVRETVGQMHTYYYLCHEQDHYDIALTYANKLKLELTNKDYSEANYSKEIDDIYHPLMEKYEKTQEDYDNGCNHSLIKPMQELWDMRIKKCLENNTGEYYTSPESVVKTVYYLGQTVKRMPGEQMRQFATRCRPLYTQYTDDLAAKSMETREWTGPDKATIAFYTQQYTLPGANDEQPKECTRILACAFMPLADNSYKRVMIDTFTNEDKPVKIAAVFFANADNDKTRELVIMTTSEQKDREATGTLYNTRIYAHTYVKAYPAKLRRIDETGKLVDGGWDGLVNGKPVKAKFKTQKDVEEGLKKLGY